MCRASGAISTPRTTSAAAAIKKPCKKCGQDIKSISESSKRIQLPKILITSVASTVLLRIMLEALILTDRNVLKVKHQKNL